MFRNNWKYELKDLNDKEDSSCKYEDHVKAVKGMALVIEIPEKDDDCDRWAQRLLGERGQDSLGSASSLCLKVEESDAKRERKWDMKKSKQRVGPERQWHTTHLLRLIFRSTDMKNVVVLFQYK